MILAIDVIDEARHALDDPDQVRWADHVLLGYLSRAQREIVRWHPWAALQEDRSLSPVETLTSTGQYLAVSEDYFYNLVDYVCYLALSQDNADSGNAAMGGLFKARFFENMGIVQQ